MLKNLTKKVLAIVTATAMLVSVMPFSAVASSTGTVALTAAVVAPRYVLGLPKTIAISLNPLLIGVDAADYETQGITSTAVAFSNLSNLPVTVDVSLIPKMAKSTVLVAAGDAGDLVTETAKKAYLFVELADSVKGAATTKTDVDLTSADWTSGDETVDFEATASGVTKSLDFQLLLDAADFTGTVTATSNATNLAGNSAGGAVTTGAIAFRVGGAVSSAATWLATDFGISIVYDARAISSPAADALVADGTFFGTAVPAYVRETGFEYRQIMAPKGVVGTPVDVIVDVLDVTAANIDTVALVSATGAAATVTGVTVAKDAGGVKFSLASTWAATATAPSALNVKITDTNGVVVTYPITLVPAL